jgi:cell division septum initiation protein DivIVA
MGILEIIEEIEAMVEGGSRVPLTSKVLLDGDNILDGLDRIRSAIPEEIRQAKWVTKERERILKEARDEAERMIKEARNHIERLAAESEVTKKAQVRSQEIVAQAQETAQELRSSALGYADDVLAKLEVNLEKNIQTIREGRQQLRQPPKKAAETAKTAK